MGVWEKEHRFILLSLSPSEICENALHKSYVGPGSSRVEVDFDEIDSIELYGVSMRRPECRSVHKLSVQLFEGHNCTGESITFPGPAYTSDVLDLDEIDWDERVRSIRVTYQGPLLPAPHEPGTVVVPAPPAPKVGPPGSLDYDVEWTGPSYTSFWHSRDVPKECQKACDDDPKCRSWVFIRPGTLEPGKSRCYLKASIGYTAERKGYVSGRKPSPSVAPSPGPGITPKPYPKPLPVLVPDIAGSWKSSHGVTYEIAQTGTNFTWFAPALNQNATGNLKGHDITVSWQGSGGTVKTSGKVSQVGPGRTATRIEWEGGMVFERMAVAPAPGPGPSPTPPPAPPVSIAGKWKSNIGLLFEVNQTNGQFTWSLPALKQEATGNITGYDLSVSWTDAMGSGQATGKVVVMSASGEAQRIEWSNGIIFDRPSDSGLQPTPVPSPQATPQVAGKWKGNTGLTYLFKQNGDQFTWKVMGGLVQKASGKITGMDISASWEGVLGTGSATGKITTVDPSGKATRIEWSNGIVFHR
jgi:hypothetical protein